MSIDPNTLRNTFTRYATGVTVVSCVPDGGEPVGITVNSFTSVSMDPPLVLWCIDKFSGVFSAYAEADTYAITILNAGQAEISTRFATPGQHDFKAGETETLATGAPVLIERLAALDCRVEARHEAGDHVILVGRIVACDFRPGEPLIYAGRQYVSGPDIE